MEALYKSKGRFGACGSGREKRKECNKLKSRAKRDSLLATRRKMSIGADLNVTKEMKSPLSVKGKDKQAKPNDRLERLREWQKAREEAKAKSKAQSKKPVFAVRGTGKPQAAPSFSFSAKKTILCASPKPARPAPASRLAKPASHQAPLPKTKKATEPVKPAPVKPAAVEPVRGKVSKADPKPTRQVVPTRHSARLAAKQVVATVSKNVPPVKQPLRKKTSNHADDANGPPKGVRTSKRNKPKPSNQKENMICESKKVPPVTAPITEAPACDSDEAPIPTTPKKNYKPVHPSPLLHCRSASKQRRGAVYVPDSMYINDPAWIPGAAAPQVTQHPCFEDAFGDNFSPFRFTAGSESSKEAQFDFTFRMETGLEPIATQEKKSKPRRSSTFSDSSMNTSQINKNVSAGMLENLITFSDTSDCPSSDEDSENSRKTTRKSRSASKRRQSSVGTEIQNDSLSSPAAKSPKVGSQRRSSRKSHSSSKGRQPSDENEGVVSLPTCKNSSFPLTVIANSPPLKSPSVPTKEEPLRRSSRKSRSSSKQRKSGVYSVGGEVVRNLEMDYDKENALQQEDSVNIPYFRELHADACTKLEQLSEVWEEKAKGLEQDQNTDDINKEEVLGQMRTTCCQARLLMRQKLHQYIGLVDMAETNSGERKTTKEDLQGFWDMVFFQVDGLYTRFSELADMESAGWQMSFPSPKKPKLQKRRRAAAKKPKTAEDNERLEAARKKREAGRAKLRELRSKSNQQPADSDMLIIF